MPTAKRARSDVSNKKGGGPTSPPNTPSGNSAVAKLSATFKHSSFVAGTTEAMTAKSKYIVRHLLPETCCESPYVDVDDWPTIDHVIDIEDADEDAGEENTRTANLDVIGGVWEADGGKFIAFWAADADDDSHVEFYCREGLEEDATLGELSGVLCSDICKEMADVLDDGSGIDRDPTPIPPALFTHPVLGNLYA